MWSKDLTLKNRGYANVQILFKKRSCQKSFLAVRHEKAYGHASAELGTIKAGDFSLTREACEGDVQCPILPGVQSYYHSSLSVLDAPEVSQC